MKKVFFIIGGAMVAVLFCMSSCKKTCICTQVQTGISSEVELDRDAYEKCSDMNTVLAGEKIIECK